MAFEISELIQSGSLPKGWSVCKVSDVADVNSASISKRSPPDEIAYLDISSVSTRSYEKPKRMKFADAPSRAQRIVKAGDTLIATVRPNLRAFVYIDKPEKNLIASTGFACVTSKKSGDALYLHYFLTCEPFIEYLVRLADGAAYPAFDYKLIPLAEMPLPSVSEREEIGDFLGALDNRITLLRETNATLEAIAQALFKSWFVDFEPVHAKQQGRAPEGMDEATAALFPDSFEKSELGLVPKGWGVVRLDSFVELAYGKALKAENRKAGPTPVYGSGGITGWHDQALVEQTSIIVGRKGTVGSLYWESRPFFPIDTVFYVKSRKPLTYCYLLLKTLGLDSMNTDAAVPGLNRENAYRLLVTEPPENILAAFNSIASVLRTSMDENDQQAQTLSTLRDTLLPRLISGQLRLPQAEAMIENA